MGLALPRRKYRNRPVYVSDAGDIVGAEHAGPKTKMFDSQSEYRRWCELVALQQAGKISGLRRQVRFDLHALGGAKLTRYVADFVYVEAGRRVVEDRKGKLTQAYKLRKAWMKAEHGVEIRETR
jgi:hypothetical protein